MTLDDMNWTQDVPHTTQGSSENCNPAPKERIKGAIVPFKREIPVPNDDISARDRQPPVLAKTPAEVLNDLRAAFNAFSGDPAATAELVRGTAILLREIAPHGRPSGVSPPDAPALELPASPPAWWRDRQPGETPDNWLRTHYKPFIDAGLITRGFFQRPRQDKAFSNALLAWERDHQLPADLYIPTKSELVTRQLRELGIVPEANDPHPPSLTPEISDRLRSGIRDGARLYQAARRRLG